MRMLWPSVIERMARGGDRSSRRWCGLRVTRLDTAADSVEGPTRDFLRKISGSGTWRCGPGRCYGQAPWRVNAEHFEDYTVW
jgi:hypothetical protein